MKKYLAILLSVVLLLTSIISTSMFTASADGIESTADIPTIVDSAGLATVDNTANLPFDKLLKITANGDHTVDFSDFATGDGIAFYIENNTGAPFFPGTYWLKSDAGVNYAAFSSSEDWYILDEGDTEWTAISIDPKGYCAPVPNGFKGYVYLPISTSKILSRQGGALGTIANSSIKWVSMGYGMWANYASAVSGGSALVSAPFAVNGIVDGLPSVDGVTVGDTYYDWFAPVEEEEPEVLEDTAVMPEFSDMYGNGINMLHTSEYIPSSVVSGGKNVGLVENTSNLPFSTLFKFDVEAGNDTVLTISNAEKGKGALIYVEMPKSIDGNDLVLPIYFDIYDGQSGEIGIRHQYSSYSWYYLEKGAVNWETKGNTLYGTRLPSEFKGYVYIPFVNIKTGANDDPSTPESEHPVYRHVTNDAGDPLYKDNITGEQTTSATDENGNPNEKVLKTDYQPSSANGDLNCGFDEQDYLKSLRFKTNNTMGTAAYNMTETDSFVTSAPIIVKGDVTDETRPDVRKVVVNSKEHYYYDSYVPYTGKTAHSTVVTPESGVTITTTNVTPIKNGTPLTSADSYRISDYTRGASALYVKAPELSTTESCGVMFYVDTTLVNPEFSINPQVLVASVTDESKASNIGTYKNGATSYSSGHLYYLREGDTAWQGTGTAANSGAANYHRKITSNGFKGYIYQPYGGSASQQTYINTGYFNYAEIYFYNTDLLDINGEAATFTIGTAAVVSNFNPSSPYVTVDGGSLLNPFTGEIVNESGAVYGEAEEFYGNEAFVNNGDANLMEIEFADTAITGATTTKTTDLTKTVYKEINGNVTASLVESTDAVKFPLAKLTGTATGVNNNWLTIMHPESAYTASYSGMMIRVKNNGSNDLGIGFQIASTYKQADGTPQNAKNNFQYNATFNFLSAKDNTWTNMNVSAYILTLPKGADGYLYIPFAQLGGLNEWADAEQTKRVYENEDTYINSIRILEYGDVGDGLFDEGDELIVSAPIYVSNYSKEFAGMAFVNGSKVAQNIWTGDFTAPNDYNGDLAVNLLDLVQAKDEANETDFASFRANYLNTYFNDAEYSVLSATFSVDPLTYNRDDEATILSENPDRGYRSELFVQFMSAPLTVAETPDYTVNIDNTDYTVTVEGNAIRGTKGVVDGTNIDTDYNITNYDMAPFGVGSGGAVHTVPAAAAKAYAKKNNLAYSTENEIAAAAVKMVNNYMMFDYRPYDHTNPTEEAGMTNIDVAELQRPVYDYEEGYAEMAGSASGSRYGYYKFASTREYDEATGELSAVKVLANHGRRTIFASDTESEWRSRWTHMFDTIYKIGTNSESSFTDNNGNVTYGNKVTNNIFNAYLTFTEFAHKDELPEGVLKALDYFFDFCRERGVKSCLRPAYNADYTQNAYLNQSVANYVQFRNHVASQCADEETIIAHIKQMAPVIAENKDVIHKISSGWIGFGGEMAAGYQYPAVSYKKVITALLDYHCIPNGLYFSSRSSTYYTNIINGVEAVEGYNSGNLDLKNGLSADAEWAEKYAKWCGFNNDSFFGAQNFSGWGSGAGSYQPGLKAWETDTANAAYAPNDGELYTNINHVYNITIGSDGVYHWIGEELLNTAYRDTDNKIPTGIEAIIELAHHRYTDLSQWHGYLDNINTKTTTTVMELWQDHDAEWVFEGAVDSVANGDPFNAEERAAAITAPITKELLEANGILYDPAWFASGGTRNAYEFIRDHLGYRLVAKEVAVNYDARRSDKVNVTVTLNNYGFAAAFNMESRLAVFDSDGNLVQEIKAGDPSVWYNLRPDYYTVERSSSAQKDVLNHKVTAAFDELANGTYYIGLKLSNTAGSTARLANDVEVNDEGYNMLGSFRINKL